MGVTDLMTSFQPLPLKIILGKGPLEQSLGIFWFFLILSKPLKSPLLKGAHQFL